MTSRGLLEDYSSRTRVRSRGLDALRGLAVLTMVADHVALFAQAEPVRWTIGRVALPLFFLLAGHLARRLSWRLLVVLGAGLLLPVLAPWVDSPNVLVWIVVGSLLLAGVRRFGLSPWLLLVVSATLLANGQGFGGDGYAAPALMVMMAAGALIPRDGFAWASRLPAWLVPFGRFPLSVYVGHVLLLTVVTA